MSDTPLWLDAFEHDFEAAHERTVRGSLREVVYYPGARRDGGSDGAWLRIVPRDRAPWTGVFASELVAGRLSVVASWPEPHTLFVALGGAPYTVDVRDPDRWGRLDVPGSRLSCRCPSAASRWCSGARCWRRTTRAGWPGRAGR